MNFKTTKKLSEADLVKHLEEGLNTIRDLCEVYDNGRHYLAFSLATEIMKVLVDNSAAVRARGERKFPNPINRYKPTNLAPELPLVIAEVRVRSEGRPGEVPTAIVHFRPAAVDPPAGIEWSPFRDWWNKQVVFRASAAPDGGNSIPTAEAEHVPYRKRRTLNRREFVRLMRNKLGAHIEDQVPEELDKLLRSHYFGVDIQVDYPSGVLSLHEGTVTLATPPAAAIMREIAHEILWAYDPKQQQPVLHGRQDAVYRRLRAPAAARGGPE